MDYVIIVIVVIGMLLLAFMASQIDITIEPHEVNPIPKIIIRFRKDSSFYSFFKTGKTEEIMHSSDEPYINTLMTGEAYINYGDEAATLAKCQINLKALEDGCDEYSYLIGDPNNKFKRIDGFLEQDKNFRAIKDFDNWKGPSERGIFSNLHKITLPINTLSIGRRVKLKYNLQLYAHYREVTKGIDITYHGFFFRCLNTTNKAIFKFILPKGKYSKIIRFDLISELNNQILLNHELEVRDGLYTLPTDFGIVWINIDKEVTSVQWEVTKESPIGTIYKLKWYTEALN